MAGTSHSVASSPASLWQAAVGKECWGYRENLGLGRRRETGM